MDWNAYHERRMAEMKEEREAREPLMEILRSPVVRPELKKRALKEVLNLEFELAMKKVVA